MAAQKRVLRFGVAALRTGKEIVARFGHIHTIGRGRRGSYSAGAPEPLPLTDAADDSPPAGPDPRLEALLVECLRRFDDEGPTGVDAVLAEHPADAAGLRRRLDVLQTLGLFGDTVGETAATPAAAAAAPEEIGDFRLLRRIGEGGMGVVYLAEQRSLRRVVALKLVRAASAASPAAVARFRREGQALARLRHPHLVAVFGAGEDAGALWIAMEFVDGPGLDETLRGKDGAPRPLAEERVVRVGVELARALSAAHAEDVVHRDVKPSNVKFASDGRALLLDFGLARDLGAETLSVSGSFVGSPQYAAPEQVRGDHAAVGPATDVYGLGATLYEAATGRPPFLGVAAEDLFRRILVEDPPDPRRLRPGLSRDLACVLLKALEKDPARRYVSATAFADDLAALAEHRPIAARPAGALLRAAKWARRKPGPAAALAVAVVALLIAGGGRWIGTRREAERRRDDARAAVAEARAALDGYVARKAGAADRARRLREVLGLAGTSRTSPALDAELTALEDAAEAASRAREEAAFDVLARLERAERLDPGVDGAGAVRARLFAERHDESLAAGDAGAAAFWRRRAEEADPAGPVARRFAAARRIAVESDPPGAVATLYRYVDARTVGAGSEPRLVAVPERGALGPEAAPGAVALRVVRGAGAVRPGDVLLSLAGEPIGGALFVVAADDDADVAPGARLVAVDGLPVETALEADWICAGRLADARPPADGGHRFSFRAHGVATDVVAADVDALGVRLGYAAELAAAGGVRARVERDGAAFDADLVAGGAYLPTASPLFASASTALGTTPVAPTPVALGAYVLVLRRPGGVERRVTVVLDDASSDEAVRIFARVPDAADVPDGFGVLYESSGRLIALAHRETTHAEYAAYVDALRATEGDAAAAAAQPRDNTGGRHWAVGGARPRPSRAQQDLPVFGVSWRDAQDYAARRTAEARRAGSRWRFRLPTLDEFGAAGAAPDARRYVFGNRFRAKFASSNFRRAFPAPEPVAGNPIDESPLGFLDLAGSVCEWLDGWNLELRQLRPKAGGCWGFGLTDPFATYFSQGATENAVEAITGFRLAAERDL
jgi:predicted Ser/Thr protein kinase